MTLERPSLWRHPHPLLLASGSPTRRVLLEAAGVPIITRVPLIDERAIEASAATPGAAESAVASQLATAKAAAVAPFAATHQIVLGADQTLLLGKEPFHKPSGSAGVATQLMKLSGKTHILHSAIAVFQDGEEIFSAASSAFMTMRILSPEFIEHYISIAGDGILGCVGGYQLEGVGIHLFEKVEGDQPAILGLPLYPLLKFLRETGYLAG